MIIHEFGGKKNPVILLLPGTACHWKGNFGQVIEELSKDFLVGVVSYTGFDENDPDTFHSVTREVELIEEHVKEHYDNEIICVYGCSLGGSLVGLLAQRNRIRMKFGILGSSDLDQSGPLKARLLGSLFVKLVYPLIHERHFNSSLLQKRYEKRMAEDDPYNQSFMKMVGSNENDMRFLSKESLFNQFVSDLITPLDDNIENGYTQTHVFYAMRMGEKYRERYLKHFKDPIIHEQDLRHEELLAVYPEKWCELIREICL
ncbi:MAG: alpha/beta hydrolase [Erysipelotrichaceae bacterium]|nr:alpha/beta hydrolase [Erysipelotrichaceae bacterium]